MKADKEPVAAKCNRAGETGMAIRARDLHPREQPMTEIHVIRHGETEANVAGLVSGQMESPLTALGEAQARALGASLEPPYASAYASPLDRSERTVRIALEAAHARVPISLDTRLIERNFGVLEGKPARPIPELHAGDLSWKPPGGESYVDVLERVQSFFSFVVDRHAHQRILVSTHMGTMRMMHALLTGEGDPQRATNTHFKNAAFMKYQLRGTPTTTWQ